MMAAPSREGDRPGRPGPVAGGIWHAPRDVDSEMNRRSPHVESRPPASYAESARREAERARDRTTRLLAVTAALVEAATREEVAEAALREGIAAVGAAAGAIGVLVDGGEGVERLAMIGYPPEIVEATRHLPIDALGPVATTVRTGQAVWLETNEKLFGCYPQLDTIPARRQYGAAISVPLLIGKRSIGVMALRFAEERPLDEELRNLTMAIAGQCALALERSRLFDAERAARAEAEAAVRLRDDFLSSASHDLKTPLTVLQGRSQLLQRQLARPDPPNLDQLVSGLNEIQAVAVKMEAIIAELQDVAHLQIGRPLELHRRPTDLVGLVQGEVDQARRAARGHQIRIDVAAPSLVADVDPLRLGRVLSNLLNNAVRYSPKRGEVSITVAHADDGPAGGWITIAVQDRGLGIPAADLPHIFERFHRGANVSGRIAGTGVGLTGARQIVEQHGGTITVESREGEGSTFAVRLPHLLPNA